MAPFAASHFWPSWPDSRAIEWSFTGASRAAVLVGTRASPWFKLKRKLTSRRKSEAELVTLKAICGPGDDAEPVVIILPPGEV